MLQYDCLKGDGPGPNGHYTVINESPYRDVPYLDKYGNPLTDEECQSTHAEFEHLMTSNRGQWTIVAFREKGAVHCEHCKTGGVQFNRVVEHNGNWYHEQYLRSGDCS